MSRLLITCPVCKADQHTYRKKICNHDDGILRCTGSGLDIKDPSVKAANPKSSLPGKQ
jgi:hypothetical protein